MNIIAFYVGLYLLIGLIVSVTVAIFDPEPNEENDVKIYPVIFFIWPVVLIIYGIHGLFQALLGVNKLIYRVVIFFRNAIKKNESV